MNGQTYEANFGGGILQRGFWLYVWEILLPDGAKAYYVGRTGDSATTNAQSPYTRMGQHLGGSPYSNMLRGHLNRAGIDPEKCCYRMVAHGPIYPESHSEGRAEHDERRDLVAALERELSLAMKRAGYRVMNDVKCRKPVDTRTVADILAVFSERFPELASSPGN